MGSILHKDIRSVDERYNNHVFEALKGNAQSDGHWVLAARFMQIVDAHQLSTILLRDR